MTRPSESARFWAKVEKTDACWLWTAGRDRRDYGTFRLSNGGKMIKAHQWAYRTEVGAIADGLELDHLCRTPSCVRPTHLEAVTHQENVRRAKSDKCAEGHPLEVYGGQRCCRTCTRARLNAWQNAKRAAAGALPGGRGAAERAKTECVNGHPFTPENTGRSTAGHRFCRECARASAARKRARARAAASSN